VLFLDADDYHMFRRVLHDARARFAMRILAYAVMPNHWHLILWPNQDLQLSRFMHWLTLTHTQRWHTTHGTTGSGPLYQGRYKAIPIQSDEHLLTAIGYVERNPVRAGLCKGVQDWQWSSVWERNNSDSELLASWPLPVPNDWLATLNQDQDYFQLSAMRNAVGLNTPIGDDEWRREAAATFDLKRTFRPQGRPCKK
jgi:putative transposase